MSDDDRIHRGSCEPAGFFVMRTPLLPLEDYKQLTTARASTISDGQVRDDGDQKSIADSFARLIATTHVREALTLASTDLCASLPHWCESPLSEKGQRTANSLRRYLARMAFRSTPFGLFAGCSIGSVGAETSLSISGRAQYVRRTRLDSDVFDQVLARLSRENRNDLIYHVNDTLRTTGTRLTYIKFVVHESSRQNYVVAIDPDSALLTVLDCARNGARINDLSAVLQDGERSEQEITDYVHQLIDEQVLTTGFGVPLTAGDPIPWFDSALAVSSSGRTTLRTLTDVQERLNAIDASGVGVPPSAYERAVAPIRHIIDVKDLARIVQVDLWKPSPEVHIGNEVVREARRAVDTLHSIYRPFRTRLDVAREAFLDRFDRQEIPLLDALDDELGIGFQWDETRTPMLLSAEQTADRHLLNCYRRVSATRESTLDLSENDLRELRIPHGTPLPDTFILMFSILATSTASIQRGDFQLVVNGAHGPSGAELLARFCHLHPDLSAAVISFLHREASFNHDAIYAEIVHHAGGRVGNVLQRPKLRDYEIPYLGTPSVDTEHVIDTHDLLLSVVGGGFVVRSATLDREVVPRLSNAHRWEHKRNLPVYQFLAALQTQNVAGTLTWPWGCLGSASWLPRVCVGRLVLSRQRWHVGPTAFSNVVRQRSPGRGVFSDFRSEFARWADDQRAPEWMVLTEGDARLPIRVGDETSERWVFDCLRRQGQVILEEMLPTPDQLCVTGPEGKFAHELILPLVRKRTERDRAPKSLRPLGHMQSHRMRSFAPGSEWLYVKLYTGRATTDVLLRDHLGPFITHTIGIGAADKAFFLRYTDPHYHIRLRFHGAPERLLTAVLPSLGMRMQKLVDGGLVWKVQFDTYDREIERYGGIVGVTESETIFSADSAAAINLLCAYTGDDHEEERDLITMLGVHVLFGDFGISGEQYIALLARLSQTDAEQKTRLTREYRTLRAAIEAALQPEVRVNDSRLSDARLILHQRSIALTSPIDTIKAEAVAGHLSMPLEDIAASHTHMFVNRFCRDGTRELEQRIYGMLERYVRGQIARFPSRC